MKGIILEQLLRDEVYLICQKDLTIRKVAKKLGRSKSSVYLDVTKRLKDSDIDSYHNVRCVLERHKQIRHILGGQATKEKYRKLNNMSI